MKDEQAKRRALMLVERKETIELLHGKLNGVNETGGQVVLLCGEAGIGKSAVIEAFLNSAGNLSKHAIGLCDPLQTPRPLGPVRDICRILFDWQPDETGEMVFFEGFIAKVATIRGPFLIVIEDLHWADQKSLDWLNYIGRRISQLPILLIGSFRDDEVEPAHPLRTVLGAMPATRKHVIVLAPLSLKGIRQLAADSVHRAEQLKRITGGNPFFLTEILNQKQKVPAVPISVADAVNARINTLPGPLQELLELVSCFPAEVSQKQIKMLTEKNPAHLLAEACDRLFLLSSSQRYKFRHELARLVVYERLPASKRMATHAKIMSMLLKEDTRPPLDEIVHHASGAGDREAILEFAPRAAELAAQLGAHREAALHLRVAIQFADDAPVETAARIYEEWAHEAGLALKIDDEVIAARSKAVQLWEKAGQPERVAENLRWLSRMHWYRGEADVARNYLQQAIALLENQSPSEAKARAFALRAQFHMLVDNMAEAIDWAQKAILMAELVGDAETRAHALNTAGSAEFFRGNPKGENALRESLELSLRQGFHVEAARAYTNLSECLIESGALTKAEALLEKGIAFDTAHDLDSWTYYLIGRKAQLRFEQDRYGEALTIAQSVLKQGNQTLLMRMPAMIIAARSRLRLGKIDAQIELSTAIAGAEDIKEPQYLAPLHTAQIEAAYLAGEQEKAATHVQWFMRLGPDLFSPRKQGEFLFWSTLCGFTTDTSDTAQLPAGFRHFAEAAYVAAFESFIENGAFYFAAWALVACGETENIRRADEMFGDINAEAARKKLRDDLAGCFENLDLPPLPRGHYKHARQHPYGLTRKELIVLRMLVNGTSNKMIAKDLSRSQRTIDNHVSSILSKMQAKNRMEVLLRASSEPWILEDQVSDQEK